MVVISKRVAVTIAAVYGALVLLMVAPMYLFSFQQPGFLFMQIAGGAYIFTLLPAALVCIWSKKVGATWMILVSIGTALALCINEIARYHSQDGIKSLIVGLAWWTFIAMIPCFLGFLILTGER